MLYFLAYLAIGIITLRIMTKYDIDSIRYQIDHDHLVVYQIIIIWPVFILILFIFFFGEKFARFLAGIKEEDQDE